MILCTTCQNFRLLSVNHQTRRKHFVQEANRGSVFIAYWDNIRPSAMVTWIYWLHGELFTFTFCFKFQITHFHYSTCMGLLRKQKIHGWKDFGALTWSKIKPASHVITYYYDCYGTRGMVTRRDARGSWENYHMADEHILITTLILKYSNKNGKITYMNLLY
jgi:hypothetical protein